MAVDTASLQRLAHALALTYWALTEVIQDLQFALSRSNSVSQGSRLNEVNAEPIIAQNDFKAYYERELYQRCDLLDERYGQLILREAELRRAYRDLHNVNQHDLLLSQLDAVQQEMTEILDQLS